MLIPISESPVVSLCVICFRFFPSGFWVYVFACLVHLIIHSTFFMKNYRCCRWCYFPPEKIAGRQAYWWTDYYNPIRVCVDYRLCFSFDRVLSATGQCLFPGCSLLGISAESMGVLRDFSRWLVQYSNSSLRAVRLLKLPLKAFWEEDSFPPWLLSCLPCTTAECNQCLEGNTSQVLGLVFCPFLNTGMLTSQVFNFVFLSSRDYQNAFWHCGLFLSSSAEVFFAWILFPFPSSHFGICPKGKSACRILTHCSVVLSSPGLFCSLNSWLSQEFCGGDRQVCVCARVCTRFIQLF